MRRLNRRSLARPYSAEAQSYSLSDYQGVKLHWKCNETSGTDMVDEVHGLIIRPTTSIAFGSPTYSVHPECATGNQVLNGPYPTFDLTKYVIVISIGRCTNSATGRSSLGQITPGPGIGLSFASGMHVVVMDDNFHSLSVGPDAVKTLTEGTDYILVTIVRPFGENIEGRVYTTSGTLVYSLTVLHDYAGGSLASLTPVSLCRPQGIAFYQWITYQFTTEPSDLVNGLVWHAAMSMQGIKSPYPAWRNRT